MEKDADVRERILLVRRVRVNNEIAAMVAEKEFHRSRWWAYKWLKRFDKLGLDGLKDKHRSGRPSEVSEEIFAEIRRQLSENSSGWKAKEIMNIIHERTGVRYHEVHVYIDCYINGDLNQRFLERGLSILHQKKRKNSSKKCGGNNLKYPRRIYRSSSRG